jgi:hypothetical protein
MVDSKEVGGERKDDFPILAHSREKIKGPGKFFRNF